MFFSVKESYKTRLEKRAREKVEKAKMEEEMIEAEARSVAAGEMSSFLALCSRFFFFSFLCQKTSTFLLCFVFLGAATQLAFGCFFKTGLHRG